MTGRVYPDRLVIIRAIHSAVLPAVTKEPVDPQCNGCPWRSGDRPCVWPRGVCGFKQ